MASQLIFLRMRGILFICAANAKEVCIHAHSLEGTVGGAYGYIMQAFAKAPQVTSTEATTESCSRLARQNTQYSFSISGNRGYVSNRVRSLSILHFVLHQRR